MGPTSIQINIWAMPGRLSAGPAWTVREAGVTILPPKRNLAPRFNEWLNGELEIGEYLDRLVAIPDTWIELIRPFPKWLLARSDCSIALYRSHWFDSE